MIVWHKCIITVTSIMIVTSMLCDLRLGLSANGVEKVLRMALTVPLSTSELPTPDLRKVDAMSSNNVKRMKAIDPTGTWSCLNAAYYCKKHTQDPEQTLQVTLPLHAH